MPKTISQIKNDLTFQQIDDTVLDLIDLVGATELRTNYSFRSIYDTVYRLCVAIGDSSLTNGIPYFEDIYLTVSKIIDKLNITITPTNYQIVATQTAPPMGQTRTGNTGARTDVQLQNRTGHYLGKANVSTFKIGTGGYYILQNSPTGQTALGNSTQWECAVEKSSPSVTVQGLIGGSSTVAIASNNSLTLSDPISISISKGSQFFVRQNAVIPTIADKWSNHARGGYTTASNTISPASASQVAATGAFSTPSGGITTYNRVFPHVILGVPDELMMSVLIIGDSIADGLFTTENSTTGARGYIQEALQNINGYPVPWHAQTVSGFSMDANSLAKSPALRATWQYCTHVIFELGYNDISTISNAAMQALVIAQLTELKAVTGPYGKPLHVSVTSLTPAVSSSSNSWIDAAGQTINTAVSDKIDIHNAWLQTLVGGGLVDTYINLRTVTDDPVAYGKWATNGTPNAPTTDGAHPRDWMRDRMIPVITSWGQARGIRSDGVAY